MTINVPTSSLHYIVVFAGTISGTWVAIVQMTSQGGLRVAEIYKGSGITVSTTNDTLVLSVSSSYTFRIMDMVFYGNTISKAT